MHEVRIFDPRGKLKQVISSQELWDRVFKQKHQWRGKALDANAGVPPKKKKSG